MNDRALEVEESRSGRWPEPLAGLRGIKVADLPRETAAGITLAAMIIPLNIGFTQVADLPPTAGLYAGIIPLVLFAMFTSSRQVVASADAPITALMAQYHLLDLIGENRLYPTNRHAIAAYRQEHGQPGPEAGDEALGSSKKD